MTMHEPVDSAYVHAEELEYIEERRHWIKRQCDKRCDDVVGMALSGGGSRAVGFHLGVIQAFTASGFFPLIDYVSAVGAGSYVGGYIASHSVNAAKDRGTVDNSLPSRPLATHARAFVVPHTAQPDAIKTDFPVQSGGYEEQSDAVRRLLTADPLRPIATFDLHAIGIVLKSLVFLYGCIALCSYVVVLWKFVGATIDWEILATPVRAWLELYNPWLANNRWIVPFLPFALFSSLWIGAWLLEFHLGPSNLRTLAPCLLVLTVTSGIIGIAAIMGVADIKDGFIEMEDIEDGLKRVAPALRASLIGLIIFYFLVFSLLIPLLTRWYPGESQRGTAARLTPSVTRVALPIVLLLATIYILERLLVTSELGNVAAISTLAFIILGMTLRFNAMSVVSATRHADWRRCYEEACGLSQSIWLKSFVGRGTGEPYLLISGTVFTDKSATRTSSFVFSDRFCGNSQVGYIPTFRFCQGSIDVAYAMAISGSGVAESSEDSSPLMRIIKMVFNLDYGQWLPHPASRQQATAVTLFRLIQNWIFPRHKSLIYVTDGGIHDNLGLEELLMRRCQLIIVSDSTLDPKYSFSDFAAVCRRVRVDHGIRFVAVDTGKPLDFDVLSTDAESRICARHYFAARVIYPTETFDQQKHDQTEESLLICLKASMTGDEDLEIGSYRAIDRGFPHSKSRGYDANESYRQLGFHIGSGLLGGFQSAFRTPTEVPIRDINAWFLRDGSDLCHKPESSTVAQIEQSFNTTVNRMLHGPTMDRYSGYLCATFEDGEAGGTLIVWMQDTKPATEWHDKLDVRGRDAEIIEFDLRLDCVGGRINPPQSVLSALPKGRSELKLFHFLPATDCRDAEIWVEVFQKNRRVLVVPIVVGSKRSESPWLIRSKSGVETRL